jgi:hypothetical protein
MMKTDRTMALVVIGAALVGALALMVALNTGYTHFGGMGMGMHRPPGDFEIYFALKAVLSSVNMFLLVVLTGIYFKNYSETGLSFSLGLTIFSLALFMYAITSNPLLVQSMGYMGSGLGPFTMLPDLFTFIASFTLLYISR